MTTDPPAGDDRLAGVARALRGLVGAGLGPAIGLRSDWATRSAIGRVARLGPTELRRRLAVLYDTYHGSLLGYAESILHNRHDAEEVVSEAFARVLRADPDLDVPEALVGYMKVAVRNVAFDRGSASTRDRAAREPQALVDLDARLASHDRPLADRVCDDITLVAALNTLSERQRQCLALRYIEDLPVEAVAARLGISEGNVKRICHEARARVAAAFETAA
jgi:RNA polymerase sigma factor (sigma-70 family)